MAASNYGVLILSIQRLLLLNSQTLHRHRLAQLRAEQLLSLHPDPRVLSVGQLEQRGQQVRAELL